MPGGPPGCLSGEFGPPTAQCGGGPPLDDADVTVAFGGPPPQPGRGPFIELGGPPGGGGPIG